MQKIAPLNTIYRRITGETLRTYRVVRTDEATLARAVAADCGRYEAAERRRILA